MNDAAILAYENENIGLEEWKTLSNGEKVCPEYYINVAAGKSYSYENCSFDERAPQNSETKEMSFLKNLVKCVSDLNLKRAVFQTLKLVWKEF